MKDQPNQRLITRLPQAARLTLPRAVALMAAVTRYPKLAPTVYLPSERLWRAAARCA